MSFWSVFVTQRGAQRLPKSTPKTRFLQGSIWDSFWDDFGAIWGPFGTHFRLILDPFWAAVGALRRVAAHCGALRCTRRVATGCARLRRTALRCFAFRSVRKRRREQVHETSPTSENQRKNLHEQLHDQSATVEKTSAQTIHVQRNHGGRGN